jgi:hypothetical protein
MATPQQAPRISEELQKMECEPIDAVESKLIWWTFSAGVVLLVVLVLISRAVIH